MPPQGTVRAQKGVAAPSILETYVIANQLQNNSEASFRTLWLRSGREMITCPPPQVSLLSPVLPFYNLLRLPSV